MSESSESISSRRTEAKPCTPVKKVRRVPSTSLRTNASRKAAPRPGSDARTLRSSSPESKRSEQCSNKDEEPRPATPLSSDHESSIPSGSATTDDKLKTGVIADDYRSARNSPIGNPIAREVSPRMRRGSEGDTSHQTSTPELRPVLEHPTLRPRSDSSLLRIKAQLRAAAEAEMENSTRAAEEPGDLEDGNNSIISDISAVGGGALHEMPRLANILLQKTKGRLEESRNLNRDIRENVVCGLHGLHEMILRLADSRNRHIAEKEKQRAVYERRLCQLESKHAAAFESLTRTHQETEKNILEAVQAAHKEAESARWLFLEVEEVNKENKKTLNDLVEKLAVDQNTGNNQYATTIQEDIAMLRLELGTLNIATLPGSQHRDESPNEATTKAIETVRKEVASLRQDLCTAATTTNPLDKTPTSHQTEHYATSLYSDKTRLKSTSARQNIYRRDQATNESPVEPCYPLMVESTDPRDTCDDVVKRIKNKVDVIELGIGVNSIRKRKNQKVLIACDSGEGREKLEKAIKHNSQELTVSQVKTKRPLLRLSGVINDTSDKQVEEAIIKQNATSLSDLATDERQLKIVRRTKGRSKELSNVIIEVTPAMYHRLKDTRLRIGYQVIPATDQSPVIQCYRCLGFSHLSRDCRNQTACGHCADPHDTRDCTKVAAARRCTNCSKQGTQSNSDHAAYSRDCPEWNKWDRIARSAISYC